MKSPCIDVCTMDPQTGLCEGCGRTLQEIADWAAMSEPERERIMGLLPGRMLGFGMKVQLER